MSHDNTSRRRRETIVVVVLAFLFGCGTFFFLLLISGWFLISALMALAVVALLGGLNYLFWGRRTTQELAGHAQDKEAWARQMPPSPSQNGFPVSRQERHG